MKAFAIGDLLLPPEYFDRAIQSSGIFTQSSSKYWPVGDTRAQFRDVVRRLETLGPCAFDPSKDIFEAVRDIDALFIHQHPVSRLLIASAPNLRYILSARGGVENIDLEAAKECGIAILNCPAHNAIAVAEYTIGLMIAEMRNIARSDAALRSGSWREFYPDTERIGELSDSVVGLIGFGTIGRLVAERLEPFGSEILIHDPFVNPNFIDSLGYKSVDLDELLEISDIVSLHGRLPQGAPPLIGKRELALMKPSAYLINTARAALVDMDALILALQSKSIMGAAVDVFPTEPLSGDSPLLCIDNLTITNHRGGDTFNSYVKAPDLLIAQLKELIETGSTRFMIR